MRRSHSTRHAPQLPSLALLLLAGCTPGQAPTASAPDRQEQTGSWSNGWPAPAPDDLPAARCADVGAVRACWPDRSAARITPPAGAKCRDDVCLVPRPLPADTGRPTPHQHWRCDGQGPRRRCWPRGEDVPAFTCTDAGCRRPVRVPDEADWACLETAGALLCRARAGAAGVLPRRGVLPGWLCGPRRGHPEERLCLDLSPDLPPVPPAHGRWRCDVAHEPGPLRRCMPTSRPEPRIGADCAGDEDCPEGALCVGGRCLPRHPPPPECWQAADCGSTGRCHLGRCHGTVQAAPEVEADR